MNRNGGRLNIIERAAAHRPVVVALLMGLVVVLVLAGSMQLNSSVSTSMYPITAIAASSTASSQAASIDSSDVGETAKDEDSEHESIEDEDVPMAGGLGGSEPVAVVGANLQWLIIGGIVAALVFFTVATLRVNRNMTKMKDRMR